MEHSRFQLDNLPDEILMIIFKKLNNCEILYSLLGVNQRLDTIVNDSPITKNLTLTTSSHGSYQFSSVVLDRFCFEILPKINDKIEKLSLESSSMERILRAADYPNLHKLCLFDVSTKTAHDLVSGKIF
jgi:hypothetical protein